MKDYLSAQGGLTYQDPEMEDPLYIGLAITNKADRARRLGIYTKSQFSHGSGEFFGDGDHDVKPIEPTVGFTHGVEVGLTAKLDYHKVIDAEVVLPYTASGAFAVMGATEFLRYAESSLVTARLNEQNSQLSADDVKDGQVYHLGEHLRNDHLHALTFFSLTIKHNGVSHHFGLDGLKHPALLTRDLNRQLAIKIPGVIGFFSEKTDGSSGINLYLSIEDKVGEIQIPAERHLTIHYPNHAMAVLPSFNQGMHLNAFLDADVTLSHTGMVKGAVIESVLPEVSFVSETTNAFVLIENATKMKPTDSITSDEKYLVWETDIAANQFKNLAIDSRYSATVVQLTPPNSFPGKALSLAKVEYVIDGEATPADLVPCFRNLYKDGTSTPDFRKGVIFTDALHADNLGWNDKPGSMGMFGCFDFVDKSTRDHTIVETAGHTAEVKQSSLQPMTTYYIAVVAPPSTDVDSSPFFRTPKDVKLRVTYFLYEEVEFMEPVVIDAEYDFINKRADLTYEHPVDYKHLRIIDRAYFILNGHYHNAFTDLNSSGRYTTYVPLAVRAIAEGEYPESFSVNFELTGLLSPYQKSGDYAVVKKPFTINYSVKYPNTDVVFTDILPKTYTRGIVGNDLEADETFTFKADRDIFNLGSAEIVTKAYFDPEQPLELSQPLSGPDGSLSFAIKRSALENRPLGEQTLTLEISSTYPWKTGTQIYTVSFPVTVEEEVSNEMNNTLRIVPVTKDLGVSQYYANGAISPEGIEDSIFHDLPQSPYWNMIVFGDPEAEPITLMPTPTHEELVYSAPWPSTFGYITTDIREVGETPNHMLIFPDDFVKAVREQVLPTDPTRVVLTEDWVDENKPDNDKAFSVTAEEFIDVIDNSFYDFSFNERAHKAKLTLTLDTGLGGEPIVYRVTPIVEKARLWASDLLTQNQDYVINGLFTGLTGFGFVEYGGYTEETIGRGGSAYKAVFADGSGETIGFHHSNEPGMNVYVKPNGDAVLRMKELGDWYVQFSLLTETDMDLSDRGQGVPGITCHYMKTVVPEHKLFHHRFFYSVTTQS